MAALAGLILAALGWLVKISTWKGRADSTMSGLQHQMAERKDEIAGLETAVEARRQAHDDCRDDLTKSMNRVEKTLVGIHTELRLRPCQQQGHSRREDSGNPGKPGEPRNCSGEDEAG